MTAQTILPANSVVDTGYNVANSLMFNRADGAYLVHTNSGTGSYQQSTFSAWVKRSSLGTIQTMWNNQVQAGVNQVRFEFDAADKIYLYGEEAGGYALRALTTSVYRDIGAWYHVLVIIDTPQSAAADRIKLYVNGVQVTLTFSTTPAQNANLRINYDNTPVSVGSTQASNYLDGYMAEVYWIDGTVYATSDFGEFDEDSGIWKPIDASGLTFGTNGFYLDFENSSALGDDAAGSNDFSLNNLAATDQGTDTCTNNFVTLNRLDTHASATLSQGNTGIATTAGGWYGGSGTMGITLGQSLYFEAKAISTARLYFGLSRIGQGVRGTALNNAAEGDANFDYMWRTTSANSVWYGGSDQSITIAATSANDICACRVNTDGQVIFYKNDAVVVTYSTTLVAGYFYFPILSVNAYGGGTESWLGNFGNPSYAISSSNTDPDGYGDFEFSTKSAYALNTKNLAEYG